MLNIRRISQRALQVRAWQQCYQPDLETVSPRQGGALFPTDVNQSHGKSTSTGQCGTLVSPPLGRFHALCLE
ncbi:hypothetical protein PY546_18960 [Providencia stuartii]|nr:hypothetical protein [Providencia stuartii]